MTVPCLLVSFQSLLPTNEKLHVPTFPAVNTELLAVTLPLSPSPLFTIMHCMALTSVSSVLCHTPAFYCMKGTYTSMTFLCSCILFTALLCTYINRNFSVHIPQCVSQTLSHVHTAYFFSLIPVLSIVSCPDPTQLTRREGVWCHKSKSFRLAPEMWSGHSNCRAALIGIMRKREQALPSVPRSVL